MTTSSPPAKRQLTLRKACAGPRTPGETERQTQYAIFNEHKIQELHGLADGYVQAWTARCSALSMTGDRAPVRPGTSMKPDPEAHEQHLDTAEMLDTAGVYCRAPAGFSRTHERLWAWASGMMFFVRECGLKWTPAVQSDVITRHSPQCRFQVRRGLSALSGPSHSQEPGPGQV